MEYIVSRTAGIIVASRSLQLVMLNPNIMTVTKLNAAQNGRYQRRFLEFYGILLQNLPKLVT